MAQWIKALASTVQRPKLCDEHGDKDEDNSPKNVHKDQIIFRRNRPTTSQILTVCWILEGIWAKILESTILFVNFSIVSDCRRRDNDGANTSSLLSSQRNCHNHEWCSIKTRKYKFTHWMETQNLDIVNGVLQGDNLAPNLFIICLGYVLRTSIELMKENGFILIKATSRNYYERRHTTKT